MKVPVQTTLGFPCPDCGTSVPMVATFTSETDRRLGTAEIRVIVDSDANVAGFTEHVMAEPEAHPSFAARIEP